MELVYDDLRGLAQSHLQAVPSDHVLQPTALVHEVFLKLVGSNVDCRSRSHFFALGAKAMRYILVDYARGSSAQKRGGDRQRAAELAAGPRHPVAPVMGKLLETEGGADSAEETLYEQLMGVQTRAGSWLPVIATTAAAAGGAATRTVRASNRRLRKRTPA